MVSDAEADQAAIRSWLSTAAVPLTSVDPGGGSHDLSRIRHRFDDALVVGLGEATHGTHEFFRLKHRLVEYLVKELGYDAVAWESSHSEGERLDRYVVDGDGDPGALLSDQGYLAWDTEEVLGLLVWLRRHNQAVPRDRRVRFHGVDINSNAHARRSVVVWLGRVAPSSVAEAEAILGEQAEHEARWPRRIDDAARARLRLLAPRLDRLVARLVATTDPRDPETGTNLVRLRVISQWVEWNAGDPELRSRFMGENTVRVVQDRPGARVIVWAHNGHVAAATTGGVPSLGGVLRRRFGHRYLAVGLESATGGYLGRTMDPDGALGELGVGTLADLGARSLPGTMAAAGLGSSLVDLHVERASGAVERFLREPIAAHDETWLLRERAPEDVVPGDRYDLVAFIDQTRPTHPTDNARRRAAAGEGL